MHHMKNKTSMHKHNISTALQAPLKWSGLQARMTFSYVWVTIACILLLEILIFIIVSVTFFFLIHQRSSQLLPAVEKTARQEASRISRQMSGSYFDPRALQLGTTNFTSLGNSITNEGSLTIPHIVNIQDIPAAQSVTIELFIAPNKTVEASSYPDRYTIKMPVSQALPYVVQAITSALSGKKGQDRIYTTPDKNDVIGDAEPVWSQGRVSGAIYVETPYTSFDWTYLTSILSSSGRLLLISSIIALLLTAPIGGIFGLITTRGLVYRLLNLVTATTLFADGNYDQQVSVTRKDEIGQLEQQFNRMAEQLRESIAQRQELAEQNARLSERSRISRELHDAISQDLFSLSMLAGGLQTALPHDSPLQTQVTTLGTTTTNTIREMRALLLELRPLQLEDLGLAEGLKELAISYSTRLGIMVNTEIATVQLSAKAEHTLLRISQEALTNAVRHANATTIMLSLVPHEKHVTLTISDNGSGFSPEENKIQHGLGLRLMQERVQELNGTFTLESTPSQGTRIYVCLPQEHPGDSSLDC